MGLGRIRASLGGRERGRAGMSLDGAMLATTRYAGGDISIGSPDPVAIRSATVATDVAASVATWLSRAEACDDICYFAIHCGGRLVGQILLHDIQWSDGEALVAYHLFQPSDRG